MKSGLYTVRKEANLDAVSVLRQQYVASLAGPLEPYIEELIGFSQRVYSICWQDRTIGYFCVSSKGTLLQFYVVDAHVQHVQTVFGQLLNEGYFQQAFAMTRDRLATSVCLEFQKSVVGKCYLFEDSSASPLDWPAPPGSIFRLATRDDIPLIRSVTGDFHDVLDYTLESAVADRGIFVLLLDEELLATGVIARQKAQPAYADIGMFVNTRYRQQKLGTRMIALLRDYCHQQGITPLASCQFENTASKRTLERAGLVSRDRIFKVTF